MPIREICGLLSHCFDFLNQLTAFTLENQDPFIFGYDRKPVRALREGLNFDIGWKRDGVRKRYRARELKVTEFIDEKRDNYCKSGDKRERENSYQFPEQPQVCRLTIVIWSVVHECRC